MVGYRVGIAVCALTTLLCASCATGAREEPGKKTPKDLAQLYSDLGTQALLRGDFPQAVEDLRKALTVDSGNAVARNHLGLAYYGLGKKKLAKEEITRATEQDPSYSDAYINLGNFALEDREFALARRYYNRALENLEYKMRHRALTNLAEVALSENKTDEARLLLYQSIQANPDYCLSHFLLGTIFMREGNTRAAAPEFKKSILNTCASNVEGHYQLGLAHLRNKDYPNARSELSLLIEQYPTSLQAQKAGEQLKAIP